MLECMVARLIRCERVAIGVLLLVMSALAFTQVITRYVFFYSLVWLEELTRYCMIMMTFLGASIAVDKEDNIAIDIVPGLMRDRFGISLSPVLNIVILLFSCVCLFYAGVLTDRAVRFAQETPAMRIPMAIVYGAMGLAYACILFHAVCRVILSFRSKHDACK